MLETLLPAAKTQSLANQREVYRSILHFLLCSRIVPADSMKHPHSVITSSRRGYVRNPADKDC